MNLTQARNEIHQLLLSQGETELADSWKEVGDMMQGGLSAEEVVDVLQRRQGRALVNLLEKINLKD